MGDGAPRALRVGIDVGGTFTDVVAIDAAAGRLVARIKIPTTHDAPQGVAAGIVEGIARLLEEPGVEARTIAFVAHSTTQATNALLEGDLARVGVLGLLGRVAFVAENRMRFGAVPLESGGSFAPAFAFAPASDAQAVRTAVDALIAGGAQAIAASESFGVDRPGREDLAVAYARSRGVEATAGHDVSCAYGLRARTRTAALNAAILPKMIATARTTAAAVERAEIPVPLMVMRSDGGVMDVREVERRPILTLLSGPAAGLAGALLYERLSEGIFIEVGGTSADCSAVRAGRPQMQSARIGGHRTMLRTLDVRTLGIGGGSMLRIRGNALADVGPRSAHIAGCAYAAFSDPGDFKGARIEMVAPAPGDPAEYAVAVARDGRRIALTTTCAANLLGCVPEGAFARGNADAARRAFELLAREVNGDALALARVALDIASGKIRRAVERLVADYELDPRRVVLVGGGGGAGALVPFAAQAMGLRHRIARDADVIAPIGVALALVRDVVERTIAAPTPQDISRIRREAGDRVVAAGASPDGVEVEVEIDSQRSRVRATASGATALAQSAGGPSCGEAERREAAADSLACDGGELRRVELTGALTGYERGGAMRVVDERGVVRLSLQDAVVTPATAGGAVERVRAGVERATRFGDVGRRLPALYLLRGGRIAAFEGLSGTEQAADLAAEEIEGCGPAEPVTILVVPRSA